MEKAIHSPDSSAAPMTVIAIGSSAGGLEAIRTLLPALPPGKKAAMVILQHHDPQHHHLLSDILDQTARVPVQVVADQMPIAPDRLYVPPPGQNLLLEEGIFKLQEIGDPQTVVPSIDTFLLSFARFGASRGIAVILSGKGSDGVCGIREFKAAGGIIIAQSPESARFPEMPRAALATGCVDLMLSPEKIGAELAEIISFGLHGPAEEPMEAASDEIERILGVLFQRTGCDFSDYKLTTINRRIGRRMSLNKMVDLKIYANHLAASEEEISLLFKDLLISVTSFFRDPDAFASLEKVLHSIVEHRATDRNIRIWIPGCATGEEVYSIAISLAKVLGDQITKFKVQIFATDVDPAAVAIARKGVYPKAALAGVDDAVLRQNFSQINGLFQVSEAVRNMIVFSQHDLLKDPPFSRIDLISCRNVLIYFNTHLQKRIMSIFHYALNANGYLFLGKSESGSQISDLFVPVDTRQKLFQRRGVYRRPPINMQYHRGKGYAANVNPGPEHKHEFSAKEALENLLLEIYGHSSVLVNDRMDIVYVHGDVSPYLGFSPGTADLNILSLAKGNLGIDLRIIINKCLRENAKVYSKPVVLRDGAAERPVRLCASPVRTSEGQERLVLVVFEPIAGISKPPLPQAAAPTSTEHEARISELNQELTATKEYLQTTIEELENTNQDLLSLNEELHSTNEELQSTNEELETSNEELQAANEELITLNEELEIKTTELAKANAAVKESETRFRTLFENIPVAISLTREDGAILAFNSAYQALLGYSADELRSLNAAQLYQHPHERQFILEKIKRQGAIQSLEVEFKRKDKRNFTAHMTVTPFAANGAAAMLTAIQDVTDRKKAEADLRISEAALAEAQRIARLGSWEWHVQTNKVIWSNEVFRIYGYASRGFEPTLTTAWDALHPEDKERVIATLEHARSSGASFDVEYRIVLRDGQIRTIHSIGATETLSDGQVSRIFGTIQDITERKQAEEEKIHLEKKLQQAHKMEAIGTLAGGIAHDFNNILAVVMANTELAIDNIVRKEPLKPHLEQIQIASLRARDLIQQLLSYSRKSDQIQKPINIAAIVKESLRFLRASIPKSIDIRENIVDSAGIIVADPTQIHQVMLNLCSNAADAMHETGGVLTVELAPVYLETERPNALTALPPGPYIRLSIKDTGSGMPSEVQARIFEPFFTTKETGKGTGMGLSMVQGIVKNHGGHIGVTSQVGFGTTFEILLPKVEVKEEAAPPMQQPVPMGKNEHILLVDDEPMLLQVGAKILQSLGYQVTPIGDGKAALEAFRQEPDKFDLILTDHSMPRITGMELAREFIQLRRNIPIILCSGYSEAIPEEKAKEAGIYEVLLKPFSRREMAERLSRILNPPWAGNRM